MHLHHPSLSTAGKKKGKVKFRNADEARNTRELDANWKELQKKWGIEAEDKKRKRAMNAEPLKYDISTTSDRSNAHIKSLNSGAAVAVLIPSKVYTGNNILGISQMAKSNAVPVFNSDHIIEIARMRR